MGILSRLFQKRPKAQLRAMAKQVSLPALPKVAMDVRQLLRDDRSTNDEIGDCLKRDPVLTIRLLKRVNAAASARNRRIADPTQAVGLLGRADLEYLVLAYATAQALPVSKATGVVTEQFWTIAVQRASLAETLARQTKPAEAGLAYAASLLQDMAVPMLATTMHAQYASLLGQVDGCWAVLDEHERAAFGWDHGEFGGWMCEAWAFPDEITGAVTSHHRDLHDELRVPDAVRAVASLQSLSPTSEELDRILEDMTTTFGISEEESKQLLERVRGGAPA